MTDQLLTPAQVAEQLQVGVRTIYEYIHTGQLAATRLGHRTYRIRQDDVDKLTAPGSRADACS